SPRKRGQGKSPSHLLRAHTISCTPLLSTSPKPHRKDTRPRSTTVSTSFACDFFTKSHVTPNPPALHFSHFVQLACHGQISGLHRLPESSCIFELCFSPCIVKPASWCASIKTFSSPRINTTKSPLTLVHPLRLPYTSQNRRALLTLCAHCSHIPQPPLKSSSSPH
ncbi:hypothetical protein BD289DRAFT_469775, partial [Coniella lustricola]